MSRPIPRLAFQLACQSSHRAQTRVVESPCRKGLRRALSTPLCVHHAARCFGSTAQQLKKAGKANKSNARSDSSPPVSDLSASTPTDEAYDVSILEAKILKAMEHLTHELSQLRSGGRFNPDLVENLKVQLGTVSQGKETVRLKDIAQVVPKGRLLNVMVGEKEHVKPVSSAIAASEHNLAPQQPHADSPLTIPVPIPPPTGESRQAALDTARKAGEKADRAIQDARATHHKKLRKFQLEKAVLPDDLQKATKIMEEVVKKGHAEIKRILDGSKKALESS